MSGRKKKGAPGITAAERAARNLRARRKFKAIARLVMANLFWLGDLDDTLGENVMLNIQKLTRKKIKKSTLTTKEKLILTKPKEDRTDEEKHMLNRAIGGLRCFRRYPPEVKSQLAAVTYFVYIGPDRVIVKQDHAPSAMYFLLSGEGLVTVKTYDKMLKEWIEEEHGTVGPGVMFGEVALIHGIARTATITTTMPSELLMIKKEDFDIVLKETVWKAWEQTAKIINRFSYFKNWDDVTKRECSIISRTKFFSPDEVILGDDSGLLSYSYLITKGTCSVIEHLQIAAYVINGITRYKLYIPDEAEVVCSESTQACHRKRRSKKKIKRSRSGGKVFKRARRASVSPKLQTRFQFQPYAGDYTLETHFMKVCELHEGAIFNVGENFERRRVVAETNTSCLMIPRYWLLKMNRDNIWNRVTQYLNTNIPNSEKLFVEWNKEKRFAIYRQKLVNDLYAQKKVMNTNSIHNVPYSIRIKESLSSFMT